MFNLYCLVHSAFKCFLIRFFSKLLQYSMCNNEEMYRLLLLLLLLV
jgi:hypothetical protein